MKPSGVARRDDGFNGLAERYDKVTLTIRRA
jgi:hypothetical protein